MNLVMPPALNDALADSISKTRQDSANESAISDVTDEGILSVNPDEILDALAAVKPGSHAQGPLSREQLAKMFKKVTMPNGEEVTVLDFKGTEMEGHEEAFAKQASEVQKRREARARPSSSRSV